MTRRLVALLLLHHIEGVCKPRSAVTAAIDRLLDGFAQVAAQRLAWAVVRGENEHQARRAGQEAEPPARRAERPARRVLPPRRPAQRPAVEAPRPAASPAEQVTEHRQERSR